MTTRHRQPDSGPSRPRSRDPRLAAWTAALVALAVGCAALAAAPSATAAPPDEALPEAFELAAGAVRPLPLEARFVWPEEELYYSVRVNGAEAMRASVRAGSVRHAKGVPYVPISGLAQSVGFFASVYPMEDRGNTYFDPFGIRPLRSEKNFEERGQTRTYSVDFAHDKYKARVVKTKEKRIYRFNYAIPGQTHDMFTWVYDLRSRPVALGDKFVYYVYDGWKLSKVHLEVVDKQEIYTPMGWFKTWRLDWVREVLRSKKRGAKEDGDPLAPLLNTRSPNEHTGSLWLSRDQNRLPVRVTLDTKFGTIDASVIKYQPHDKELAQKLRRAPASAESARNEATAPEPTPGRTTPATDATDDARTNDSSPGTQSR